MTVKDIKDLLTKNITPYQKPNQFLGSWSVKVSKDSVLLYRDKILCYHGQLTKNGKAIYGIETSVLFPWKKEKAITEFLIDVVRVIATASLSVREYKEKNESYIQSPFAKTTFK